MCGAQGVEVNPTIKIRPTIDKRYIEQLCVNPEENPPAAQQPPSPSPIVEDQPLEHSESSTTNHIDLISSKRLSYLSFNGAYASPTQCKS